MTATGAFAVVTGAHTGRSAADKFVVRDRETEDTVWWDNAKALTPEQFDNLHRDFLDHASHKNLFVQDLVAGAAEAPASACAALASMPDTRCSSATCFSFQNASNSTALRRTPSFASDPERHGVRSDTIIACDLVRGITLIGGTSYAGEIKNRPSPI